MRKLIALLVLVTGPAMAQDDLVAKERDKGLKAASDTMMCGSLALQRNDAHKARIFTETSAFIFAALSWKLSAVDLATRKTDSLVADSSPYELQEMWKVCEAMWGTVMVTHGEIEGLNNEQN